jgi:predicted DNA-binding protein YlxM (UPF0122 family)
MGKIDKMSVQEYADKEGISRQAVYKRVRTGAVVFQPATKYTPLMIITKYK